MKRIKKEMSIQKRCVLESTNVHFIEKYVKCSLYKNVSLIDSFVNFFFIHASRYLHKILITSFFYKINSFYGASGESQI